MSLPKNLIQDNAYAKKEHIIKGIIVEGKDTVKVFNKLYTYVFTTGGIGPTHDDITSESIAIAFNKEFCFHKEAFKILKDYYPKGEFNEGRKKMAKMPASSELILWPRKTSIILLLHTS